MEFKRVIQESRNIWSVFFEDEHVHLQQVEVVTVVNSSIHARIKEIPYLFDRDSFE